MPDSYLAVVVYVHLLPEAIEAFRAASLANAEASIQEPGVVRFDVMQETADPTRFVLLEVYGGQEGAAAHKLTAHYQTWRHMVAPMMAEPRTNRSYATVTPAATWEIDGRI
ncbi:MAG TPA: antibiotic biosynthesis monooxygenase [Polyangia bacterium]